MSVKTSKKITVSIELNDDDLKHFTTALQDIISVEESANLGLGFLKKEQKEILQSILNEIKK